MSSVGADPLNGSSDLACGPRLPLGPPRPRPWPPRPSVPTLRRPSGSDKTIAGRVASRRTSVPARDSARIARTRSPGAHGPISVRVRRCVHAPLARRTARRTGAPAELRMTPGIGHVVNWMTPNTITDPVWRTGKRYAWASARPRAPTSERDAELIARARRRSGQRSESEAPTTSTPTISPRATAPGNTRSRSRARVAYPRENECGSRPPHHKAPARRQSRASRPARPAVVAITGRKPLLLLCGAVRTTGCDWSDARPRVHPATRLAPAIVSAALHIANPAHVGLRCPATRGFTPYIPFLVR